MGTARRLTLCADDFGQSASISEGILRLLAAGRLQATSVLSQGPYWPAGAPRLRALASQADIGLHLNLTHPFEGATAVRPLSRWLLASLLRRVSRAEVRDSFARQVDAFAEHAGKLPDYLDGHQHVHAFPVVREAVFDIVERYWQGSAARPWIRVPERLVGGDAPLKALVLRTAAAGFGARADARGLPTTPAFGGLYALSPDDGFEGRMKRWLRESPDRTLLMCHPGLRGTDPTDPFDPSDPIAAARTVEYAYLASDAFADDCARSGALLSRFSPA